MTGAADVLHRHSVNVAEEDGFVRCYCSCGWFVNHLTKPIPPPPKKLISTRRIEEGVVHEMADYGVGTLCGIDLCEPWTYTEKRVSCPPCREALRG